MAVIGEFAQKSRYQGAGSSVVNPTKLDNAMDVIDNFDLNVVGFEAGHSRSGKGEPAMQQKAVELAAKAELVLFYIGLDEISESEGLDRSHMKLPESQVRLIEAVSAVNPNIVAVMSAGSAAEMPWLPKCKALIHGYLYGQAGASSVLNAIMGQVNPSGKMDGAEVAQLYVSKPDGQVFRPAKELKGFQKVFLKAGESKKVTIQLDDKAFRYFNMNTNQFEVEGGEYQLLIGASTADIKRSGPVCVQNHDQHAQQEH